MKCYNNIVAIDVLLLVFTLNIYGFLLSVIELYFLICSLSYCRHCENLAQEKAGEATENTVIQIDKLPSPTTLNFGSDAADNKVTQIDKFASPTTPKNSLDNITDITDNIQFDKVPFKTTDKNSPDTTDNIHIDKVPSQSTPKNSSNTTENLVNESDKVSSPFQPDDICKSDTQPEPEVESSTKSIPQ